ncbi:hypothetical protein E2C01_004788 [Portunus trituberculatus]|uniref:Uncharacterized protein n=1 Tax=Portunus trituberculatus TaxID=210409 RepID=A0A5B7CRN5_PORTR|nr:hypothetical protein [Portunus trituberculatus]
MKPGNVDTFHPCVVSLPRKGCKPNISHPITAPLTAHADPYTRTPLLIRVFAYSQHRHNSHYQSCSIR